MEHSGGNVRHDDKKPMLRLMRNIMGRGLERGGGFEWLRLTKNYKLVYHHFRLARGVRFPHIDDSGRRPLFKATNIYQLV